MNLNPNGDGETDEAEELVKQTLIMDIFVHLDDFNDGTLGFNEIEPLFSYYFKKARELKASQETESLDKEETENDAKWRESFKDHFRKNQSHK